MIGDSLDAIQGALDAGLKAIFLIESNIQSNHIS
jgi:FMN phosphatase YigB (HAD superfamily)